VLDALEKPVTAESTARALSLDCAMLRGTLEYVSARTDLVRKTGGQFVATRRYSNEACFLLDVYALAYGRNAVQLSKLLRQPSLASRTVERKHLARAFGRAGSHGLGVLPGVIRQLGLSPLLDLGCGSGALLLELAANDPKFVGWGLEIDVAMCKVARASIRTARMGKRVHVLRGNANQVGKTLPRNAASGIAAIIASQLANEMFRSGTGRDLDPRSAAAIPRTPDDHCRLLWAPWRQGQEAPPGESVARFCSVDFRPGYTAFQS
jgi:SAM-dependent methyltransferase